ncbi:MAG: RES family NAD+ phosphorylase [Acidimicrobiales bacterium]
MPEIVAYRWADYDTPLWASPNRVSGRWHVAGSEPTQYWSAHPLGPWAEYLRWHGVRDRAGLAGVASRTWAAEFTFADDAIAIVSFETASTWGMDPADLVADDHRACQDLGRVLRASYTALVVPSAALPGTENLVVFGARVMAPYGTAPVEVGLDVPTAPAADHARPPADLLDLVCHRGAAHGGLASWRSGGAPPGAPSLSYEG